MGNIFNKKKHLRVEAQSAIFTLIVYSDGTSYAQFDDEANKKDMYDRNAQLIDMIHGGGCPKIKTYTYYNNIKINEFIHYLKNKT